MSQVLVVRTSQVIVNSHFTHGSIRKMEAVLRAQGQIQPLQVKPVSVTTGGTQLYETFPEDIHGYDIVQAARNLDWPTLLVYVQTGKFEY